MGKGGIYIFTTIMKPQDIAIDDYDYQLSNDKIALHPLNQRDASKLLVYKNGKITSTIFSEISEYLPANNLMVFNNTKVINARIPFFKNSGAKIEIFCLEPHGKINEYSTVMASTDAVQWKCLVGGAAKWKEEILEKKLQIGDEEVTLFAKKIAKTTEAFIIEFYWQPSHFSFAAIIEAAGKVPLPPYIKRNTDKEDTSRYQTIFAAHSGSVAAPTAGLHFSENIFEKLSQKNIAKTFVTLHVGAGTFKPVKAATMAEHEMHSEYIDVDIETIKSIKKNIGNITAVGTTSLRTIESLYWMGVKVYENRNVDHISIHQWEVYESLAKTTLTAAEALASLLLWMEEKNKNSIFTQTQIIIAPGYTFRIANMLVTNFHQPRSTLLLLVAAAIGDDWKKMYDHALQNEFRFLSYGDGNLIFIDT
jgi:S-adenosylmethionine:tRNA ribosyltransferase-isomerase